MGAPCRGAPTRTGSGVGPGGGGPQGGGGPPDCGAGPWCSTRTGSGAGPRGGALEGRGALDGGVPPDWSTGSRQGLGAPLRGGPQDWGAGKAGGGPSWGPPHPTAVCHVLVGQSSVATSCCCARMDCRPCICIARICVPAPFHAGEGIQVGQERGGRGDPGGSEEGQEGGEGQERGGRGGPRGQ